MKTFHILLYYIHIKNFHYSNLFAEFFSPLLLFIRFYLFYRKKVLNQFQTAQNVPTVSSKKYSNNPNQNYGVQPTFQKLKPGKLFQNNSENNNSFERFQTSPTKCPTKSNNYSGANSEIGSTSPQSPSLIRPKAISSFKPASNFPSSSGFSSGAPFNKDKETKKNAHGNQDNVHSNNNSHMNSTCIEIQDIETQNLFQQTNYDIHEDDHSPGRLGFFYLKSIMLHCFLQIQHFQLH